MTMTNAELIAEVLRRQAQIRDICEDGDPANQEAYDRLRRQNADAAPELARRLREAEEKLARANEALRCIATGRSMDDMTWPDVAQKALNALAKEPIR